MEIIFLEKNNTGIITLNRPKALNALNIDMAKIFSEKLQEWNENVNIKRVLLIGEGKHFCAGGDVKSLYLTKNENNFKEEFFRIEYKLNYLISQFKKEYLSIWNGVVMGGGVGLSIYGDHRMATDNTKFAMPETSIGFFPDVGASYFLSNLPKNVGKFIGLTGQILEVNDLIYLGLATDYFKIENLELLKNNYINSGELIRENFEVNNDTELIKNIELINLMFEGNLNEIISNLENNKSQFSSKILDIIYKKCPMSLYVSTKLINDAKGKSLKECLEIEYQLSQKLVYRTDFDNGVNTVLVTKDHNPQWSPAKIDQINTEELNKYFETHTEKLYL
jgi:enoyl-CoA hydratase/carnithine racemase|tara:strand:- start:246 stop:1250 length:1005 start_codon:yes stop_codon:yes gene_type:complete